MTHVAKSYVNGWVTTRCGKAVKLACITVRQVNATCKRCRTAKRILIGRMKK